MIHSPLQAKPDLGLRQLEVLADGTALNWAKQFVLGKLKNQLNLLKFYLRHREETDAEYSTAMKETENKLEEIEDRVRDLKPEVPYEKQRNHLFGLEGQAGVHYWRMVRLLVPSEVGFTGRITRGAEDLVNIALNFGYSLLYPRIERALLLAGLNVNTSLFHSPQIGKPTLSFLVIYLTPPPPRGCGLINIENGAGSTCTACWARR
jgi:CRISPR-associated protein Cas1